ncbi:tRNA lysidine(34) synthetase TilS [Caldibacillus lycopersici]|uniref:tRNA(Ile)-lysidine synthase n=1 Tax=Perspicuibacillus lycopersici TaxID=1325689 RepID=A0AAE3IW36_9BACI|nr:tRNA lysidine(34) synthetase TilS [Perspicuibacillus lycopersici]MCU9615272.1 tRNA lysidine(34) synthetase TilS [Perspicuibacillus lycopersici]
MDLFEAKVNNFIERHKLLSKGLHVLVGVSGGPDSLAMLYFLKRIREQWDLKLTVAHVDHMFRGEQSFNELKYVEQICTKWDIGFEGVQLNVPLAISKQSKSSQAVSRELRYQFYQEVMEKHHIPVLALAHHGDDQMETILMRLTRGSSLKGSAGIRVHRDFGHSKIIRPFLCVTKAEIEEYIRQNRLEPVYDPSNKKDIYTRNRFRKYVLPFLKQENKNVHMHFQRFSEELTEDEEYIMNHARTVYNNLVTKEEAGDLTIKRNELLREPMPLQRRCIHLILNYLYKGKLPENLAAIHINYLLETMGSTKPSSKVDLPNGLQAIMSYQTCRFTFNHSKPKAYTYEWNKGETITLPNGNQLLMHCNKETLEKGNNYYLLKEQSAFPLIVRTRNEGDRIQLKGSGGTKKIKSVFIDYKIPLHMRDEWPIVTDREGNILWIPLLKKSQFEALNQENVIILQYKTYEDF